MLSLCIHRPRPCVRVSENWTVSGPVVSPLRGWIVQWTGPAAGGGGAVWAARLAAQASDAKATNNKRRMLQLSDELRRVRCKLRASRIRLGRRARARRSLSAGGQKASFSGQFG
jgi:hypothetical protein